MLEQLDQVYTSAMAELQRAQSLEDIQQLRLRVLG